MHADDTEAGRGQVDGEPELLAGALARASFEHALDAILVADDERWYTDANPAACLLLGLRYEDVVSRRMDDFVPQHARSSLDAVWDDFLARGSQSGEFELVAADGSRRQVEFRATASVLPGRHLSVLRDITGRAAAEEAERTKAAYEFLAGVLGHLEDGLHVVDEHRRISFVNPMGARVLGYDSPEDLLGLPVHETIHYKRPDGSTFSVEECPHLAVLDTGQPCRGEDFFVCRDGSMLPVSYSAAPIPLPGGRGAVVAFRDISQRRRVEDERERERELMGAVLESLDTGVVACDSAGVLSLFNRATREMHGISEQRLPPADWAGRYDLFMRDGQTPMRIEDIPLFRALQGERVRDAEMVIAPKDRPPRSVLCSGQAMRSSDGRTLGAVVAMHDVTERKQAQEQLTHQALHDPLTGLANRQLLLDRIAHGLARLSHNGTAIGVLFIDLDDFKAVNDEHGHDVGDETLVAVGERLRDALRNQDTIARHMSNDTSAGLRHTISRLGGDEFVVMLEDLSDPADAAMVAQRILAQLRVPLTLGPHELSLNASVGITLAGEGAAGSPSDILREADTAMYAAKRAGKARYQLFEAEMHHQVLARTELMKDLRSAVAGEQLRVVYQPQVDVASGRMTGVEALVRWEHPKRGLLTPDHFISAAESGGMIVAIDDWVMREACAQLREWDLAGLPALQMAVNVSAGRLTTGDLARAVAGVLRATQITPERLEIELTETVAVEHDEVAVATINSVRELGVRVAIDDFGIGHSALSRLQSFPVDRLKIDRSFISPLTSHGARGSIADAMIAIGQSLGLEVVAEGVETREHLHALRALGCRSAQGYLFSKPVPADTISRLAHSGSTLSPAADQPVAPDAFDFELTSANQERLTRTLLAELQRVTGLETTYLTRIDWDDAQQHITHARNTGTIDIPEGLTVDWTATICRRALEEGITYTDDVRTTFPDSQAGEELGLKTYLSVPLVDSSGAIQGTLCGASSKRVPLGPQALQVMERFGQLITQGVAATPPLAPNPTNLSVPRS